MGSSLGNFLGLGGSGGLNLNSPLGGLSDSSVGYGEEAAIADYLRFLAEQDAANYGYGEAPDYLMQDFYDYGQDF
jgi:hypothetical protein